MLSRNSQAKGFVDFHSGTWILAGFFLSFLALQITNQIKKTNINEFKPQKIQLSNLHWIQNYRPTFIKPEAQTTIETAEVSTRDELTGQVVTGLDEIKKLNSVVRIKTKRASVTRNVISLKPKSNLSQLVRVNTEIQSLLNTESYRAVSARLRVHFKSAVEVAFEPTDFLSAVETAGYSIAKSDMNTHSDDLRVYKAAPTNLKPRPKAIKEEAVVKLTKRAVAQKMKEQQLWTAPVWMVQTTQAKTPIDLNKKTNAVTGEYSNTPVVVAKNTETNDSSQKIMNQAMSIQTQQALSIIEAFNDKEKEVESYEKEWVTKKQSSETQPSGWVKVSAKDHMSVLAWVDYRILNSWKISIPSNVSIQLIEKRLGELMNIQNRSAGIVFGELSPGMNTQIKVGKNKAILLTESFEDVTHGETEKARYYIASQVEPGVTLVELTNTNKKIISVHVPVHTGVATFLQLKNETMRSFDIESSIFDAGSVEQVGVHRAQVHLVADKQNFTVTDINGRFVIKNVTTSYSIPMYIEVSKPDEYNHRYLIDPIEVSRPRYFFQNDQVTDWLDQLVKINGFGISEFSGIVVGAKSGQSKIKLKSWNNQEGHSVKFYKFDDKNELSTKINTSTKTERFIATEISGGSQLIETMNRSELIVTSRGVITVIEML